MLIITLYQIIFLRFTGRFDRPLKIEFSMQIILSKQCESLTGSLGQGFGYVIVKRGKCFFSQRCNHNVLVPPDGHWRFIVSCAKLAQNCLHITDVIVPDGEIRNALLEAGLIKKAPDYIKNSMSRVYHAADILNLKNAYGL